MKRRGIGALTKERDALLARAVGVQERIDNAKRRKVVVCNHCDKRTPIRLLTYVQTYWYREPYGCTGGDYWSEGEGRFICAKCGYQNRLIYRPEVVALKRFFKEVVKSYGDDAGVKWCN